MKKLYKFIRLVVTGTLWSCLFVYAANAFFIFVWNFDLLNAGDWQIVSRFWNSGGKIKTGRDYLFLFSFLLTFCLWIWGWKKAYKINYVALLLAPLEYLSRLGLGSYGDGPRIVIKNIGTAAEKIDQKEIVKQKLKEVEKEIDAEKETSKIRELVADKISSEK